MTGGRKTRVQPEFLEATSVEDAIGKLQALKKRRVAEAGEPPGRPTPDAPKKRGRPPKVRATETTSPGGGRPTAHRPLGLLEVQDKADLDALLADPKLAAWIAMRLDDHFALVLPAHLERLQAALLKAGHTPRLNDHTPEGPGHRGRE